MHKDEFDIFLQTVTIKDLKEIITHYQSVKGISNYRKVELIEAFANLLSEDDQEDAYKTWMPKKIQDLIQRAIQLTGWSSAEFELDDERKEYSVEVAWSGGGTDKCTVNVNADGMHHKCTCKIGESGGICVHLMTLIVILYLKEEIRPNQFPIQIDEFWLQTAKDQKDVILTRVADIKDAIINLDEYWFFIRGNKITTKWTGDYAGIKTVDLNSINAKKKTKTTVEEWIVKKVVDKQLESLRNTGRVREIVTDKYGVIDKILNNEKQFKRLLAAFQRAADKFKSEEYPQSKEEIREALRIGLIE
ncbi:MAG: hypothetical protein JW776_15675 [Candidatus Lokiarchaeota archaeon]|nr:hypothetical protein [Candidatus Lokiarchaeota archaeon]